MEFAGIDEHGGIGSAFHRLAQLLVSKNMTVTVAYVNYPNCVSKKCRWKFWKRKYATQGINFVPLLEMYMPTQPNLYSKNSLKLYEWLTTQQNHLDMIHFHDYLGIGYHTLMAKRLGIAFQNIPIVNQAHGTWWFVNYHLNRTILDESQQIIRNMEEKSLVLADSITFPSQFYTKWTRLNTKWRSTRSVVLPNLLSDKVIIGSKFDSNEIKHLVFFGRFSRIKGLDIFIQAVQQVSDSYKITFLGNPEGGLVDGIPMDKFFSNLKFKHKVIIGKSTKWCMRFLSKPGVLVVIPSRVETFSIVVLELLFNQIRFIAAHSGAIPELVPGSVLFEPNTKSLVHKIRYYSTFVRPRPKWTLNEMNDAWIRWIRSEYESYTPRDVPSFDEFPLITILVKNSNGFPMRTLESLLTQTWKYFDVVLMDQLSPQQVLEKAQGKYVLFLNDLDVIDKNLMHIYARSAAMSRPNVISHLTDAPSLGILMMSKKYIKRRIKTDPYSKIGHTNIDFLIPEKISKRSSRKIGDSLYSLFKDI